MHGYAPGHGHVAVILVHVPVHFFVDQAENHCFVTYQSLVVAFDVRYGFLVGAAVCEFPEYRCRMPVLVLLFLESFYPVVGDTHCHSVVEANAAVGHRSCQARHSAHFLGYSYGFVVYLVYEGVGQGEVCNGVGVLGTVVVVAVSAEGLSEAVVVVQHRSDAVEAKTVEVVFFEPVFAVGE